MGPNPTGKPGRPPGPTNRSRWPRCNEACTQSFRFVETARLSRRLAASGGPPPLTKGLCYPIRTLTVSVTKQSLAPRITPSKPEAGPRQPISTLDKDCDLWAGYEWRFNLPKGQRPQGSALVGLTPCQGSRIRRKVYTLTNRSKDFQICRLHQVEVGSLDRAAAQ
jgi:hypothetical protein